MTTERLNYLLEKRYSVSLTEAEEQELELWYWKMQYQNAPLFDGKYSARKERTIQQMTDDIMWGIEQIHLKEKRNRRIDIMQRWAVAASLIMAIAISIFNLNNNKTGTRQHINRLASVKNQQDTVLPVTLRNTKAETITYYLEDGSKVVLYANSEITYPVHFPPDKREVLLNGKAFFSVEGNPRRPFTVNSRNISTTALGTSFTIRSYSYDSVVNVTLHNGRVVVRPGMEESIKSVYLKPGDELVINAHTFLALVSPVKKQVVKADIPAVQPVKKENIPGSVLFDQQPLKHVFDTLAVHYSIQISYNEIEIKDLDFSGIVRLKDTPALILQRIALLNNLLVKTTPQGYTISKN